MYKNFKYLLFIGLPLLVFAVVQTGCKKEDKFSAQALPNIITVNPTSAMPGTPVNIKGVNLKDITTVRFGTVEAVFDIPSGNHQVEAQFKNTADRNIADTISIITVIIFIIVILNTCKKLVLK